MAIFIDLERILRYHRNKPYLQQLLNDQQPQGAKLLCPECASVGLMRVAAYIDHDKITFSKGIKNFRVSGMIDWCNVSDSRYNKIRNKHLLHPELYEEKQLRYIHQNSRKKKFDFTDHTQGVAPTVQGDVIAYFMRRGRKGVRFAQGVK